jgi:hypothetical protein
MLEIINETNSYQWFFYLGIFLFVSHIGLYGFGLDLSYFGLLLIWIGWSKPPLYTWFRWFIWIFILLDLYATIRVFKDRMVEKPVKKKSTRAPSKYKDEDEDD